MFHFGRTLKLILPCTAVLLTGCVPIGVDSDDNSGRTLLDLVLGSNPDDPDPLNINIELEPNDVLETAQPAYVGRGVDLQGELDDSAATDIDIWSLGGGGAGDHVTCTIRLDTAASVLVGLFDENQSLLARANATNAVGYTRELEVTLRDDLDALYLIVSSRYQNDSVVPYTVNVTIDRGGSVPAALPQSIVLDFTGASTVFVGSRGPIDVPAFDAANISESFAGQTQTIVDSVYDMVVEDYGNLGVTFWLDTDPDCPTEDVSTIYFGTYDPALLGLADNVDDYNHDRTQSAIIYTDTFKLFMNLRPGAHDIAQALANVTSHEAGHLLGLHHTADPDSIMDVTATAGQMLNDQWFGTWPLHDSIMPTGYQNAGRLLSWAVGGAVMPPPITAKVTRQLRAINPAEDYLIPREWFSSTHELHEATTNDQ